jgi:two-component sensor histidine kinase
LAWLDEKEWYLEEENLFSLTTLVIDDGTEIQQPEQEIVYEYLGTRLLSIQYERMKEKFKKKYIERLKFRIECRK